MPLKLLRELDEPSQPPWKVLIVDDDADIHQVTVLVLKRFKLDDRPLEFLHAYSGIEAKEKLSTHDDIALIFLDVVMETDDAGLEVARWTRQDLGNHKTRIVLRTGQPGQAPEQSVVTDYDINDYKEKTELTSQKLFTTVLTAIRSYRDIMQIEHARDLETNYRLGLERVIQSTSVIFQQHTLNTFSNGILQQVLSLLRMNDQSMLVSVKGLTTIQQPHEGYRVLAHIGQDQEGTVDPAVRDYLDQAIAKKQSIIDGDIFVGYFATSSGAVSLLYLKGARKITELESQLLTIFSYSVSLAFENISLSQEIIDTQGELIYRLGDVVESRSEEAGNHVRRMSELSYELCLLLGYSEERANLLRQAAPMHDIGKIAIPDSVLLKPGKLDAEEWEVMKTHSEIGHNILAGSKRKILQTAATIAHQHHEKVDGSGYPLGLKGDEISIEARIIAVADVFDALTHERCYKPAWPIEDVIKVLKESRGNHLDAHIVDTLLDNLDVALGINEKYATS
ncbi:HD domain-containing phosphohydrolase [Vibrio paucivorans]